jgi:predicted permease
MNHSGTGVRISTWLYRRLLVLYPGPFRHAWANEMTQVFRDRYLEEQARFGWPGVASLWLAALADLTMNAPKEHISMLTRDIRYALRTLRKTPGFTAIAILCVALGIGASTCIFSVVNAVVLSPLPYRDSSRLVQIYTEFPTFPNGGLHRFAVSAPEFRELQQQGQAWNQLEAWVTGGINLQGGGEPVRIKVCVVSGGMLSMLSAKAKLGRLIAPSDDVEGATPTVVLSDGLWKRAFGGDPKTIGRDVWLNGAKTRVIGVMASGFEFPPGEADTTEAWMPLQISAQQLTRRGNHYLSLIGHLRPGVTVKQAQMEVAGLVKHLGKRASPGFHTIHPEVHPVVFYPFHDEVIRNVRKAMVMLLGAVAFFLLIACVNVANLLVARSDVRQREIAIRKAIGAGTAHLVRQFAVEGLLLSGAGAVLGLGIAWAGVRLIAATNAGTIPRIGEAGIDLRVLGFTAAVSILTGLAFGMAPIVQMVARPLQAALQATAGRASGSLRSIRFRRVLAAGELSLALVLLIGAGLLVRSFWQLQQVQPGMDPEGVVTVRISPSGAEYNDVARLRAFWTRLSERLAALRGARATALTDGLPPQRFAVQNDTDIENFVQRPGGPIQNVAFYQTVAGRFFETLGICLAEGRFFDERDGAGAPPVVIVNRTMAETFWPGESALGKRIRTGREWLTIVGVVQDVKNAGLDKPVGTELFLPATQLNNATRSVYALVKTEGDPRRMANSVRRLVHEIDPRVPVSTVRTMEEVMAESASRPRFLALMLTIFSSVAIALAVFGVYGVLSYSVTQRSQEFGIRMALGAQRADVLRVVLGEGALLGATGVAVGAIGAFLLSRVLEGMLFQVNRFDAATFLTMAIALWAASLAACWVPARRATKVDPIQSLRYE